MAQTHFSGPVVAGTYREGTAKNIGPVVLTQRATVSAASGTTIRIPENSQLYDYVFDVLTAFDGTAAILRVGSASAGSQYGSASSLTVGRKRPSFGTANLLAMQDVTTNRDVFLSVAGSNVTAGSGVFTLLYIQR